MKKYLLLFISLTISSVYGQTIQEKIADKSCEYFNDSTTIEFLNDSIKACTSKAMVSIMASAPKEDIKFIGTAQGMRGMFSKVYEILPSRCYKIRKIIIDDKRKRLYTISNVTESNTHFYKGNDFLDKNEFKKARKEFKLAIKLDENFIYAIDHLAISYKKQGNFKKAINYYEKSLKLFPEGDVALMNIAVIYTTIDEFDKSLKYYDRLIYYYQDNPEGYYGKAKTLFILKNYEAALDNIFISHKLYVYENSEYAKDSSIIIKMIYDELKKNNQEDLFLRKAKEHGINIEN